jgi:uncharacterized protein (DUF4415 family)
MARKLTDLDDAPLTEAELAEMRPAREVLPPDVYNMLVNRRRGRPNADPATKKVPVTLRLDPDVVNAFKALGSGWQTRINGVLRGAISRGTVVPAARKKRLSRTGRP